ncbi:MAG: putative AmmeMemoRadiSam system protein B, partial [Streblomastix strix]
MSQKVNKAVGAGRWFPGNSATLLADVQRYIEQATVPALTGRIVASLAPHAGYQYSGPVAGFTFRAIRELKGDARPEVVVVIGFPHHQSLQGVALMEGIAIDTPIGRANLDTESANFLKQQNPKVIQFDSSYHNGEHSAENEIPFVQVALPDIPMVVALIGSGSKDSQPWNVLSDALVELNKKKRVLVVSSTDMLHDEDYDKVQVTDKRTLSLTEAMD